MECTTCQSLVNADDAFCAACGSDLLSQIQTSALITCPQCGNPNEPDDKYCATCGLDLRQAAAPVCGSCGGPIAPDDAFCGACGSPISGPLLAHKPKAALATEAGIPTSAVGERLLENWQIGVTAAVAGLVPGLVTGLVLAVIGSVSFIPALFAGLSLTWRTTVTGQSLATLEPETSGWLTALFPSSGEMRIGSLFTSVLLVSLAILLVAINRRLTQRVRNWSDVAVVAAQPAIVTGVAVLIAGIVTKTSPLTGVKAALLVLLIVAGFAVVRTGGSQASLQRVHKIVSVPVVATIWAVALLLAGAAVLFLVLLLSESSSLGASLPIVWFLGVPSVAAIAMSMGTFAGLPTLSGEDIDLNDLMSVSVSSLWTLACVLLIVVVCLSGAAIMILRRGDSSVATRDLGIWAGAWFVVGVLCVAQLTMSFELLLLEGHVNGPVALVVTAPLMAAACWWVSTLLLSRLPSDKLLHLQARALALPPRTGQE